MTGAIAFVSTTILLRKVLERRKRRAFQNCNPNTPSDYVENCVIVWDSIHRTEKYCENKEKEAVDNKKGI